MSPNKRLIEKAKEWAEQHPPVDINTSPGGILALIRGGENETVELKLRVPPDDIVARNLVAFANSRGGVLMIGIADNGVIVGIPEAEVQHGMERLRRIASTLLPYPVEVDAVEVEGRTVVYAALSPAPNEVRPVATSRGEYYVRQGAAVVRGALENAWLQAEQTPAPKSGRLVKVFVAMSFREEEEPSLVDYFKAMERAVQSTGLPLEIVRIDLAEGDYEISQEIMEKIDDAEIVIADFTLSPRNVYFELGYARGRGRRIIQTARKDTALEFDVRNWRTIFYKNATELEEKLAPGLKAAYVDVVKSGGQQVGGADARTLHGIP